LIADLAKGLPTLLDAADAATLEKRLADRFGIPPDSLGDECALAWIADAGGLLVCDGGKTEAPKGSETWADRDASGYAIRFRGDLLQIGSRAGRVYAGTPEAMRKAIQAERHEVATLGAGTAWPTVASRLAYADGRREVGVFFVAPESAPWCRDGCIATALFAGREGGAILAEGNAQAGAVRSGLEAFWKAAREPFEALRDADPSARTQAVPDETLKMADLAVRTAEWTERGPVGAFRGKGDAVMLACLLRLDLVLAFVGK